jgi:transposase
LVKVAEIITVERRRRWSDEDKRRIVGETLVPDASVNVVAKRHGLHPSQISHGAARCARAVSHQ